MTKVWLLVIWIGGHAGTMSVPNLPSEEACKALYAKITEAAEIGRYRYCIPYEIERRTE